MKKKIKPIPEFKNEDEEFEFWSTHDTTDYFDWDNRITMDELLRRIQASKKDDYKASSEKVNQGYTHFIVQDAPRKKK